MKPWTDFPTIVLDAGTAFYRVHLAAYHPAWFNNDGEWRFDPPPPDRHRFGICYLGLEPATSYVEVFGRFRLVTRAEADRRDLSELRIDRTVEVADLTDRTVLGDFGITASLSMGSDYATAQELSAAFFDAGLDGIRYRTRHNPQMTLEAIALFGEPGEHPERFASVKTTSPVPEWLIMSGSEFAINIVSSAPLP